MQIRNTIFLLIAGVIFLLLVLTFQVRKSEVVVVTTFGKPTDAYVEPGLHGRLPWGIQMLHRFDQRVQNFEDKLTEGLTQDSFNLFTSVYVGWRITEPKAFFPKFASGSIPEAEKV